MDINLDFGDLYFLEKGLELFEKIRQIEYDLALCNNRCKILWATYSLSMNEAWFETYVIEDEKRKNLVEDLKSAYAEKKNNKIAEMVASKIYQATKMGEVKC